MFACPIVLSIKDKYAAKILSGEKTLECRTYRLPRVPRVYIYSSGKVQKVVGHCIMSHWSGYTMKSLLEDACLSHAEFNNFFGSHGVHTHYIQNVYCYADPVSLLDFGLTHAPQKYAYARCEPVNLKFNMFPIHEPTEDEYGNCLHRNVRYADRSVEPYTHVCDDCGELFIRGCQE